MKKYPTEHIVLQRFRFPSSVGVVIPAWQPSSELVGLVHSLAECGCKAILVVDDGSDASHQNAFEQLRSIPVLHLLRHACNRGKGRALKTGISHFLSAFPEYTGVVTADADGQHAAEDIASVAAALAEQPQRLILGTRRPVPEMPLRSRFGNALTRQVFWATTGLKLVDTQTGLRGFPKSLMPEILAVQGERYEFEMAVLLYLCSAGHLPIEVPVRTIYTAGNRSSHFRPFKDSAHVYRVLTGHCLGRGLGWKHIGQKPFAPREDIS